VKKLIGALAIVMLALLVSAPAAEAKRCWWNGYTWVCKKYRPYVRAYPPYYYRPYAYSYRPYYRPYYRPRAYVYACVPPFCW
jgi:hypothetical protein